MRYLIAAILIIIIPVVSGAVLAVIGEELWNIAEDFEEGWKDGMD